MKDSTELETVDTSDSALTSIQPNDDKEAKPRNARTYPSRIQKVGEMWCLFLSFYRRGTFPICSIGPSWPFTIILCFFATFCLVFLGFMMSVLWKSEKPGK